LKHLGFAKQKHDVVLRGFARPNLHLEALSVDGPREVLMRTRTALVQALADGGAAIVYCATRKKTEELADKLAGNKWRVAAYHAGLSAEERTKVSSAFAQKTVDV